MASLDSNQPEIDAALDQLVSGLSFAHVGQDQALGRELVTIVAEGIAARSAEGMAAGGGLWYANEPKYERWKKKRYGVEQPNYRTGQMLSQTSLEGDATIGETAIEMRYGTGTPPAAAGGVPLSVSDESITDIEKAFFCSALRPFYELDDDISEECRKHAMEALDKFAAETWT